ncbi:MAG TPA: hypothetical protein PLN09_16370, partial [Microthrixaceae bacterium]|nr:hypothetical protein [Microthrixaceae bacterium]
MCAGARQIGTGTETDRHVRVDVDAERFGESGDVADDLHGETFAATVTHPGIRRVLEHHGCHRGDRLDRAHTPPRHPHPNIGGFGCVGWFTSFRWLVGVWVGAGPFHLGDDGPSGLFEQFSGELV